MKVVSANNTSFTVGGIVKDFPENSSIQKDMFLPISLSFKTGGIEMVRMFVIISLLILTIACINYVNLSNRPFFTSFQRGEHA